MAFTEWGKIRDLEQQVSRQAGLNSVIAARAGSLEERVAALELQCGVQKLLLASLVKLLVDRQMLSEQELSAVIRQIDLSDGQLDGKLDAPIDASGKVLPKPQVVEDAALQELAAVVDAMRRQ